MTKRTVQVLALAALVAAALGAPRAARGGDLVTYTMTQLRVFAKEANTNVVIQNLATGAVYASFNLAAEGSDWSAYPGVPHYVNISSDKSVTVFTGKAMAGANDWAATVPSDGGSKLGTVFHGFTEHHLWIFAHREPGYLPTAITVTDFSDGDDTRTLAAGNAEFANADVEIYHLTGFEYDNIRVTSNIPVYVLAGSSSVTTTDGFAYVPPSAALGEAGSELGTQFYGFVQNKMAIYGIQDDTHVTVTDLTDGDDTRGFTLNSNSIYSVEAPAYVRAGTQLLSNGGNLFDADYFQVTADKPVLTYVGPTYSPGNRIVLDLAPAVATGPQSRTMFTYANGIGLELLTFDNTASVTVTSLTTSGAHHDYTIGPGNWQGTGPYYWQAPAYFTQELLKIEADKPVSAFYGDWEPAHFAGCCSGAFIPLLIDAPTEPPVANAGQDQTILVGSTAALNGTGYDPDGGSITLYEWDFDGDGTYDWSSPLSGATAHLYPTVGAFNAALRVTDDENESDTDICRIEVIVPPPIPAASGLGLLLLAGVLGILLVLVQGANKR